jgi:hypothetical protein
VESHIGSGTERDIWVMVDQDGRQTLFSLVEVGNARDVARVIRDLQLPVVMIDVVLPPMGGLEATPGPAGATLIVLSLRKASEGEVACLVAYKSRAEALLATLEWQISPSGDERTGSE